MSVGMVVDGNLPRYTKKMAAVDCYFHRLMWAVVPLEKFFRECKQSWDDYQKDWTENQGFDLPYVPYPYTVEMVEEWRKDYGEKVGPVTADDFDKMKEMNEEMMDSSEANYDIPGHKNWWQYYSGKCGELWVDYGQ